MSELEKECISHGLVGTPQTNGCDMTAGGIASLACMLEVTAPKPGNVHRGADFEDVTFDDFVVSAIGLGQVIDSCVEKSLGQTVLAAIEKTIANVGSNTNLGIVLLLVPLAKIIIDRPTRLDCNLVKQYFSSVTLDDGRNVFEAIKLAKPGGLGEAKELDVYSKGQAEIDLLRAMDLAKERDTIARQYVTGYSTVFESGVPLLLKGLGLFRNLPKAIVFAHVALMAGEHDSLIARKCGQETAEHSQFLASKANSILESSFKSDPVEDNLSEAKVESYWSAVGELDFWLRSDGHRRNPGTTADLIAATLFVAIYNGDIKPPFKHAKAKPSKG